MLCVCAELPGVRVLQCCNIDKPYCSCTHILFRHVQACLRSHPGEGSHKTESARESYMKAPCDGGLCVDACRSRVSVMLPRGDLWASSMILTRAVRLLDCVWCGLQSWAHSRVPCVSWPFGYCLGQCCQRVLLCATGTAQICVGCSCGLGTMHLRLLSGVCGRLRTCLGSTRAEMGCCWAPTVRWCIDSLLARLARIGHICMGLRCMVHKGIAEHIQLPACVRWLTEQAPNPAWV